MRVRALRPQGEFTSRAVPTWRGRVREGDPANRVSFPEGQRTFLSLLWLVFLYLHLFGGTLSASQQMSKSSQVHEELQKLMELNLKYCIPACSVDDLNPALIDAIIMAQRMAGFQFTITSAYRSQAYERSKGRKGTSSHCKGLAVDVSARDSHARFKILVAAAYSGIPRIGVGKTFLHLDIDETKPHPIIFHYYDPQET